MNEPQLSVILLCPDTFATIRNTVLHLARQTIADSMELVIVGPASVQWTAADTSMFANVVSVRDDLSSVGEAYASGIRAATAELVVLSEDHSFPQPGWAEAFVRAHRQDFAAVGPAIANANPHSRISRADLLIAYGRWLHPAISEQMDHLPGHNSCYRRSILLQYGERLGPLMEAETVLHWDLRSQGHRLFLEARAVTAHMNFEKWKSWRLAQFHSGRVFAAARSVNEKWSLAQRILFFMAAPLIPLVRLSRILRLLLRRSLTPYLSTIPVLFAGLCVSALGEATGALGGEGISKQVLLELEFHRQLHRRNA